MQHYGPGPNQREPSMVVLTSVRLVCSTVAALPHASHAIESFLLSSQWMLESASKHGFVGLLDRLLAQEWRGFNRRCRELRFHCAILDAPYYEHSIRSCVPWLLDTYLPDQKLLPRTHLFELAIQDAHLPLLEWLCRDNKGAFPPLNHHVTYSDPDTVIHLHEYGGDISRVQLLLGRCKSNASLQSICRCLALQD